MEGERGRWISLVFFKYIYFFLTERGDINLEMERAIRPRLTGEVIQEQHRINKLFR